MSNVLASEPDALETLTPSALATVCGGIDEQQLRSYAQQHCPIAYADIKTKSASTITRADADRCLAEAKPNAFVRGMINSQIDAFFAKRK